MDAQTGAPRFIVVTAPGLPMSAYDDLSAFKIYPKGGVLKDCFVELAQLAPTAFGEGNRLFTEFKGALGRRTLFFRL